MLKKICFSLVALFLLSAFVILFMPFSLFQGHLLKFVNTTENLNITIDKPIAYRLINANEFMAEDVRVEVPGYDIIFKQLLIEVDLNSLLKKDIVIKQLKVEVHSIVENDLDTSNVPSGKKTKSSGIHSIGIDNIDITFNKVLYKKYKIEQIALASNKLKVFLEPLLISGEVDLLAFNGDVEGKLSFKHEKVQEIEVGLGLSNIEKLSDKLGVKKNINLYGDLDLKYKARIENYQRPLESKMDFTLSGKGLRWIGKDLDKILDAYIDSKQVGVLDVAGYLTLGPLGILVAKGTDLGNAGIRGIVSGETDIKEIYAKLDLSKQVISLLDVAVATKQHRIVAYGKINLINNEFQDFKIGTVDEKGCSIFTQKISGTLSEPEISGLGSIMNETFSKFEHLFKAGMSLIVDSCDNKYLGVVK